MNTRHHAARLPGKSRCFSWGRSLIDREAFPSVQYRLFRRDMTGRLYTMQVDFARTEPRQTIAAVLKRLRHTLRDRVDDVDLRLMGVAA